MSGVNKVILLGRIGFDPEVKHLESGTVVARLSIATSEKYKNKQGETVETTEWHDVEMWEGLAKVAEKYLKKGDQVYIEGKISSQTWQDDQGNNRKNVRIRANQMTMIGSKKDSSNAEPADIKQGSAPLNEEINDLPF